MKSLKIFIFFSIIIIGSHNSLAQVKTNFNNIFKVTDKGKFNKTYINKIDYEIAKKNIDDLLAIEKKENEILNDAKPFKIAVPVTVNIDIVNLISWQNDGFFKFGKFTLKANGALSTSINFDDFFLPKNTEVFIYNQNGEMITEAITENENNLNNVWGSWFYKGEYLVIEIKTPIATAQKLKLHANNVAYGYKQMYKNKVGGFGQSGACNINVICPLGNGWEAERNSVALLLNGNGTAICSGSIIMNTCNSTRPFFLTADHCFGGQNVTLWRFTFQAFSPTCTPSQNSDGVTFNGSTLRANWAASDFCLVELNNTPPLNSGINYAGWNRANTPANNAMAIHHPSGDVMKISYANNPLIRANYNGGGLNHWRADWQQGVTEGGSSGSPLFDENHRIVGQLHGGPSACGSSQLWDFYGSFDFSWSGGGTNSTRLSNWLDPSNSGVFTTNTTNIALLNNQNVSITTQPLSLVKCVGEAANFSVQATGSGLSYQWQSSTNGCGGVFTDIAGAVASSYNISNVTTANNGTFYRVVITSNCSATSIISNCVSLAVSAASTITTQPTNFSTCVNNAATFTTNATGTSLTYQWQVSNNGGATFTNITNANSNSFTISNVSNALSNNQYRALITSACNTLTTNAALLTVSNPALITTQPVDVITCANSAVFNIVATGSTLNFQWQQSIDGGVVFSNISGANNTSYTVNNLTAQTSTYKYRIIVSNNLCGAVISNIVSATLKSIPIVGITAYPTTTTNPAHPTSINATINPPNGNYIYEWKRNGAILSNNTLSITPNNGLWDDFGTYELSVLDVSSGCKAFSNNLTIGDIPNERNRLFIYPNPTKNKVSISYFNENADSHIQQLSIFDSRGQKVLQKQCTLTGIYAIIKLDLSNLASGVYFIDLRNSMGLRLRSGKLVKY